MSALTLFDVLFEQWHRADQASTEAWSRLRTAPSKTCDTADDLIAAMRLQTETCELLAALRAELRKEREQVAVI